MKRWNISEAVLGCAFRRVARLLLVCSALLCGTAPAAWAGGSVWIADSDNFQIAEILPKQLKHSGQPAEVVNESAALSSAIRAFPTGICFDKKKNLWVADFNEQLLEFTSAQLKGLNASSNSPTPAVTITSPSFNDINGCTFDSDGNLWLVDQDAPGLDEISKTQLKAGGSITPAKIISDSAEFLFPTFLAFDKSGNLWVTNTAGSPFGAGPTHLLAFSPSQVASGGTQTAAVKISSAILDVPGELTFDNHGNLWVPNYGNNTVVMFAKKDLATSGSPAPAIMLSSAAFNGPYGMAFQNGNSGPLWIMNDNDGTLNEFMPSQIKSGGSPTPKVSLSNASATFAAQITFGPVDGKAGDTN
jgi:sugar lactone lactonase YvrE